MPVENPNAFTPEWDDAEFTGGGEDEERTCNFFPKNSAEDAIRKIGIANSIMVTLEQTILNGPRATVLLAAFNPEAAVASLAEFRCSTLRILAGYFNGNRSRGECLESERVAGFRTVSKDARNPTAPPMTNQGDCDRTLVVNWSSVAGENLEETSLANSLSFERTLNFEDRDGESFELTLNAEVVARNCISNDFNEEISLVLNHTFTTNFPNVSEFNRTNEFILTESSDYQGQTTVGLINFLLPTFRFTVEWSYQ